jgi:hypothetical protein
MSTLREELRTIMIISRWFRLRLRNVLGESDEKIKTHVLCSMTPTQIS